MPELGPNRPMLLNQLRNNNFPEEKIAQLLQTYSDLSIDDLKGIVADDMLDRLREAGRNPQERDLWNQIQSMPQFSEQDIQNKQIAVTSYRSQFPSSPKAAEAAKLANDLAMALQQAAELRRIEEDRQREQTKWTALDKTNYSALRQYLEQFPNSAYKSEIDDYMWKITINPISEPSLERYLDDWPMGRHTSEAREALQQYDEWGDHKYSKDIFELISYQQKLSPSSPLHAEVKRAINRLKEDILVKMEQNPTEYLKEDVFALINGGVFKRWDLEDRGLMSDSSYEKMQQDREDFPDIQAMQLGGEDLQAPEGCTDIYLFGTPGTGKTCLLMGLAAANGNGYTLNMKYGGGPYASALQAYANAGLTPGRTYGDYISIINGTVNETDRKGRVISHNVNFVEMAGEHFANNIADAKEVSIEDMASGVTHLLQNNNRKVFFIVIDASGDTIKVKSQKKIFDENGNLVDSRIVTKMISQLDILNKFSSLFAMNPKLMEKVDSIHFIVTKADLLGDVTVRDDKAYELLQKKYIGPVGNIKEICRQSKRINFSTNYSPHVFPFSLGKFYLGDVFDFDGTDTLKIIDAIRLVTGGKKEKSWWGRLMDTLG